MTVNYNELYRDFISRFPENSEKIKTIAADSLVEDSDGMHVLFGIVVIPFVKDLMNNNQTDKITTAFEFFEDMAKSTDEMISEVLTASASLGAPTGRIMNSWKAIGASEWAPPLMMFIIGTGRT